ncbi:MAG: GNAT family N-acetyltransferase [Bacteroidota bacterium]
MDLTCFPVTAERWEDLERVFEGRGGPHFCWCMVWRRAPAGHTKSDKAGKKACLRQLVDDGSTVGLLGYLEGEPVAWCSVAPRATYRNLGGDEAKEKVWSLVCFFVPRRLRKQGIARSLIDGAVAYARSEGAEWLEAYPVAPETNSYRFGGFVPMFEAAGFGYVKDAGKRRKVMVKRLG